MKLFEHIAAWFDDKVVPTDPRTIADSMDLNPATGLPTIAGAGTPDLAGNPYGSPRLHGCGYDWQRHDHWDSSGHDRFHHQDSWSASSHDPWRE